MSADAIMIRRRTAAARRLRPDADLDGYADRAIREGVSVERVTCNLFDMVTAAPGPHVCFRRALLAAVIRADRRALSS